MTLPVPHTHAGPDRPNRPGPDPRAARQARDLGASARRPAAGLHRIAAETGPARAILIVTGRG